MTATQDAIQAPPPDVHRLVDHLRRSWTDQMDEQLTIEPAVYVDREVDRRERELVFGRVPVAVAHSSELPEPGSFVTSRLPNNEAMLVRQPDGSVGAFVNACRHRGSLLCKEQAGSTGKRIQCPYHGWSYNLDGSLKSATHQVSFGEFDHVKSGLIRLPVEERHGFVWVVDGPDATIDVADWLGPETDALLGSYGMDEYVCVKQGAFEQPANWKLFQDAFLDGYHIQFVHRETAAKIIYTNILVLDDYGRHTRFMSPRRTLGPLIDEDRELSAEEILPHITQTHGLLPNATLLKLPDHYQLLSFFPSPKGPGWCRMEIRLVVPTLEASGWDQERWDKVWERNWQINMDVLKNEDFPILCDSQRALESANAGSMTIGRNEVANQVFHRELRKLLER